MSLGLDLDLVLLFKDRVGVGFQVGFGEDEFGHAGGALEGSEIGEGRGRGREVVVRGLGRDRGMGGGGWAGGGEGGGGGGDNVDFAVGVIAEGCAGVLERHGVGEVSGGEGVAGGDGFFHEHLAVLASVDRFFVLDL